uniref:hypothetical protein n=1 Tax=uncultured Dysgonomonas sp. TaxID=206096 RepID=UPI00258C6AF9|nr:hypothetical protein [uncultured Dysgonomonas sp.]
MKQKLFEALKTKFVGVDAQILDRIATKKAEGQTDENQITSIVDGISFQDVLQSYGDSRAGDASKTAVVNYEKKHNLKEGKVIEAEPTPTPQPEPSKPDDTPAWAKALIEQNKSLTEKIASIENKSTLEQRTAAIQAKAKEYGIPESQAKRYSIPEDADLDEYFKDAKQELSNLGFKDAKAPENPEVEIKKESESIAAAINAQTKEIVEQTKK